MDLNEERIYSIIHKLDTAAEKIENLQDQRDKLMDANKRLVDLVKQLEIAYEEAGGGKIRYKDSEYSFRDGWMPTQIIHDQNLELEGELKIEGIDSQVDEVLKTMKEVEDLKKEK
ncbi:MAG: hypothetical protein ABEJ93_02750 [Candidatus Nanohalobium sp.]